jgi:hypothetical protein
MRKALFTLLPGVMLGAINATACASCAGARAVAFDVELAACGKNTLNWSSCVWPKKMCAIVLGEK